MVSCAIVTTRPAPRKCIASPAREGARVVPEPALRRTAIAAAHRKAIASTMLIYRTPDTVRRPFANYAHAVEVPPGMRLLFLSGQLGIGPDDIVPIGAEAQAARCFTSIGQILHEAGADARAVIRLNAFVTGREHLAGYMAARDRFVADPAPASTLMIVAGFARPEFVVEVEAIAALP